MHVQQADEFRFGSTVGTWSIIICTLVIFPDIWQPRIVGHLEKHLGVVIQKKAMLPVQFCNVDFGQIVPNAHVMRDKWWLWGHRILKQNQFSHLALWHKRENASFAVKVNYNATQPENLQDRSWLPRGLHKNLGAVTIRAVVGL